MKNQMNLNWMKIAKKCKLLHFHIQTDRSSSINHHILPKIRFYHTNNLLRKSYLITILIIQSLYLYNCNHFDTCIIVIISTKHRAHLNILQEYIFSKNNKFMVLSSKSIWLTKTLRRYFNYTFLLDKSLIVQSLGLVCLCDLYLNRQILYFHI